MKLTNEEIKAIIQGSDCEVEKEHRKGGSFYANGFYEIIAEDVEWISELIGKDASSLVGTAVTAKGYWSDYDGCDWYTFGQQKKVETLVPEKTTVVPAHTKVSWVAFTE